MPRYALQIEYNGGPFAGWQRQSGQATVQQAVETAVQRLDPGAGAVTGAGRTDAGVHATGQVAHVDLIRDWDPFRLREALNFHLRPLPVSILQAVPVGAAFHARFSARERRYLFRLVARRAPVTHARGLVWQVTQQLDLAPMQTAARVLVGKHDFTTFRSTLCQSASPVKTLDEIRIEAVEIAFGTEFHFHLRARSFLHHQVRSIVGTLEWVGLGRWQPDDVKAALEARDRARCGLVCPPQGLYLAGVSYPENPFGEG